MKVRTNSNKKHINWHRTILIIFIFVILTGCAARHYESVSVGNLQGKLVVEWRKPNSFVFVPSLDDPLRFTRGSNSEVIQPDRMWTDGGSIPRPFWVFKNYSPWGYGPAFIIHDWLFHMQDCQLPGHEKHNLKSAAMVMSEVMKTLLEDPDFDYGDKSSIYLMYKAVQTKAARSAWEDRNCQAVESVDTLGAPDGVFHFSF